MSRAYWRRLIGLPWLDDEIVPDAANVQSPAVRVETSPISERATSEPAAVSLSPSGAGRTVETAALNAPRPEELRVTSSEWRPGPTLVLGDGPTMPIRSLSNENYDRVWIAQGDHVEAMGIGDTPQEAAIEYARAVADLLRPEGGPDAFDRKTVIQGREPGERGDAGDGHEPPPDYEVWAR